MDLIADVQFFRDAPDDDAAAVYERAAGRNDHRQTCCAVGGPVLPGGEVAR